MKRVTKEVKETMLELRNNKISFAGIGKILNLSSSTIQYHLNPKTRKKAIERATKNETIWKGKKEYQKNYMSERYNYDEEFKGRVQKHSRESWRKKHGKDNSTK